MAVQVKLKDIIEGLEFQSDEGSSHLNTTTGEVVYITDEEVRAAEEEEPLDHFPAWQHEVIRIANDILDTDHYLPYLPLPTKFDIHEYRIMERFCYAVDDDDMRDALCNAIRGRGAFRYFKDTIHAYGIAEDWYTYRDEVLREIAVAWCEEHGIHVYGVGTRLISPPLFLLTRTTTRVSYRQPEQTPATEPTLTHTAALIQTNCPVEPHAEGACRPSL